ncbi:MAG: hypothetical protein JXA30_09190 [Deltaproteobacteria bacterium]|nr:hypothetical protein [Deltaproteobacteria bacterium]
MNSQSTFYRYFIYSAVISSCFVIPSGLNADGFRAQAGETTWVTDNVFLDRSLEWDLVLRPMAELAVDFADFYTAGYSGELNVYTQHEELLSHWHQLYLFLNPAWGPEGEHEFSLELSVQTLRNQSEYSANNLVRPVLFARLSMEPESWFRWTVGAKAAYGWCYDDQPSNTMDFWGNAEVSFTLPSWSTLSPRAAFGYRYYPDQDLAAAADDQDQQLEIGAHFSQALWENAGLQLDYAYAYAVGESGLLLRKLTQEQFSYLDQGFLYSGNQAMVGLKQLLGEDWVCEIAARFKEYQFAGWRALDASGVPTGEERHDLRLSPVVSLSYFWDIGQTDQGDASVQLQFSLEYSFTKQWSNTDLYDVSAHSVGASIIGSF